MVRILDEVSLIQHHIIPVQTHEVLVLNADRRICRDDHTTWAQKEEGRIEGYNGKVGKKQTVLPVKSVNDTGECITQAVN